MGLGCEKTCVSDQVRLKLVSSATEAIYNIEILHVSSEVLKLHSLYNFDLLVLELIFQFFKNTVKN